MPIFWYPESDKSDTKTGHLVSLSNQLARSGLLGRFASSLVLYDTNNNKRGHW